MNMTPLATPTSPHFPAYIMAGHGAQNGAANINAMNAMGMGPPSALSPGAFWGRAGEGNVYGAPVGQPPAPHPSSPYHYAGGSPGFFGMHAMVPMEEPKGYFDVPLAHGMAVSGAVEKEIMKDEKKREGESEKVAEVETTTTTTTTAAPLADAAQPPKEPIPQSPVEPEARARRHSSDAPPPPSPMREGKRPPPLRLSATGSSGSS
ncbi:hypothetical protein C8R44DRAFT_121980 [Mycena epipterygia]|nr:hypothetical protein C8R44DRAFT_121980 [Mycena epipterygia]